MLHNLFYSVVDMSFTASYIILIVLLVRWFLKKAPKKYSYLLWLVVLFRLVMPITIETNFSLVPHSTKQVTLEVLNPNPIQQNEVKSPSQTEPTDTIINGDLEPSTNPSGNPEQGLNTDQTNSINVNSNKDLTTKEVLGIISIVVWLIGLLALLISSIVSVFQLKSKLRDATLIRDNIYVSNSIDSPFVLGLIQPKIYLPNTITKEEEEYILLHEQTHIKRFDPILKAMFYVVTCIHWFNPFVWISYILFSKDMELSCDEKVIDQLGTSIKKEYSYSLLNLSTKNRLIPSYPLAFGENSTKSRIKNILNYKKPSFWGIVISIIIVLGVSITLITNPIIKNNKEKVVYTTSHEALIGMDLEQFKALYENETNFDPNYGYTKELNTILDTKPEKQALEFIQKLLDTNIIRKSTYWMNNGNDAGNIYYLNSRIIQNMDYKLFQALYEKQMIQSYLKGYYPIEVETIKFSPLVVFSGRNKYNQQEDKDAALIIEKMLKDHLVDVNQKTLIHYEQENLDLNISAIYSAAASGNVEVFKVLLKNKISTTIEVPIYNWDVEFSYIERVERLDIEDYLYQSIIESVNKLKHYQDIKDGIVEQKENEIIPDDSIILQETWLKDQWKKMYTYWTGSTFKE